MKVSCCVMSYCVCPRMQLGRHAIQSVFINHLLCAVKAFPDIFASNLKLRNTLCDLFGIKHKFFR